MWADAQRDGHPAEYRWRPLLNTTKYGWCPLLECRAVTLPIQENERYGCTWQNSVRGQELPKCTYSVTAQETAKDRAQFGW